MIEKKLFIETDFEEIQQKNKLITDQIENAVCSKLIARTHPRMAVFQTKKNVQVNRCCKSNRP